MDMDNNPLCRNLLAWITQLLTGQNVSHVNQCLLEFVEKDECWQAALGLLSSTDPHVKFFVVNVAYTKVKKHWTGLQSNQKEEVFAFLLNTLETFTLLSGSSDEQSMAFVNRLILTILSAAVRMPNGLGHFFSKAFQLLKDTRTSVGLEMLRCVPEEVSSADVARTLRLELDAALAAHGPAVFAATEALSARQCSVDEMRNVLRAVGAWVPLQGLSLVRMRSELPATFSALCGGLRGGHASVMCEAYLLLQELLAVTEYPRAAERDGLVLQIAHLISGSEESVVRTAFCSADEKQDIRGQVCGALTAFATAELPLLASAQCDFFRTYMRCVGGRPRALLEMSFDLWQDAQDLPPPAAFAQSVLPILLRTVLSHCTHSPGTEEGGEDQEDLDSFRDPRLGLADVLGVCMLGLGDQYFALLQEHLRPDCDPSWMRLESVLYILACGSSHMKQLLEPNNGGCDVFGVVRWLHALLCQVLTTADAVASSTAGAKVQAAVQRLQGSICRFAGSMTFLLARPNFATASGPVTSPFRDLFEPTATCMLRLVGARDEQVSALAAKSFHQLCTHGATTLIGSEPSLRTVGEYLAVFGTFVATDQLLVGDDSPLLLVAESFTRCLLQIPRSFLEQQRHLVAQLSAAVVGPLSSELSGTCWTSLERVERIVLLASQIIRFGDGPTANADGGLQAHCLTGFLSDLWPMLEALSASRAVAEGGHRAVLVQRAVFELYGRMFSSLGRLALPVVDSVARAVLAALEVRRASSAALRCAGSVVEFLSTDPELRSSPQSATFARTILEGIVGLLTRTASAGHRPQQASDVATVFFGDLDCVADFFALVQKYLLFCPAVLVTPQSAVVDDILRLAVVCLGHCYERESARVLLQVLQQGFCSSGPTAGPDLAPVRRFIFERHFLSGEEIVVAVFTVVSSGRYVLGLAPNVADLLLSIVSSCGDDPRCLNECGRWLRHTIMDPALLRQLDSQEYRDLLLGLVEKMAIHHSRRFRSLVQDLFKICASELAPDCLLAYSDL